MNTETLRELQDLALDQWGRAMRAELELAEAIGARQPTPAERVILAELATIRKRSNTALRWLTRAIRMEVQQ